MVYSTSFILFLSSYEQSDGQKREETGRFKNPGTDDEILEQKGWYSYIGDDGKTYRVDYIADENGFVPTADHLPVPVETPVVKVKESVAPVEKPKIIRYNREDLPNNGWHFL